jgi:hypothetical protein
MDDMSDNEVGFRKGLSSSQRDLNTKIIYFQQTYKPECPFIQTGSRKLPLDEELQEDLFE